MTTKNERVKNRRTFFIHLTIWLIICILPMHFLWGTADISSRTLVSYFFRIAGVCLIFYANFFYLIQRFLLSKKILKFFFLNICMIGFLYSLFYFGREYVFPYFFVEPERLLAPRPRLRLKVAGEIFMAVMVVNLSLGFKLLNKWFDDQGKINALQAEKAEAELSQLKSQMNPHFLFNTLNNIYSLVSSNTSKAQDSIHRLSLLLRYILYENEAPYVPLSKELEFIQNYIELMRIRLSEQTKLSVHIAPLLKDKIIAPLIFISILENAFKHGVKDYKNGFISIRIYLEDEKSIICHVENSYTEEQDCKQVHAGIGLQNTKRRLELLYPKKHIFRFGKKEASIFFAYIKIEEL